MLAVQDRSTSDELFALAEVICGAVGGGPVAEFTVIVKDAVLLPVALEAVKVKVVVLPGATDIELRPETLPTPLSMLMVVAPETFQVSVADCLALTVDGVAKKDEIMGAEFELSAWSRKAPKSVVQYHPYAELAL